MMEKSLFRIRKHFHPLLIPSTIIQKSITTLCQSESCTYYHTDKEPVQFAMDLCNVTMTGGQVGQKAGEHCAESQFIPGQAQNLRKKPYLANLLVPFIDEVYFTVSGNCRKSATLFYRNVKYILCIPKL